MISWVAPRPFDGRSRRRSIPPDGVGRSLAPFLDATSWKVGTRPENPANRVQNARNLACARRIGYRSVDDSSPPDSCGENPPVRLAGGSAPAAYATFALI